MNIDDEIKKLDEERDGLLVEVTKKRNRINELARKIRSLETIKRHASEVLESTGVKTIELTGNDEQDTFKDPAQLDIEDDALLPEVVKTPDYKQATKKISDAKAKALAEAKSNTEEAIEAALSEDIAEDKAESIIDTQIKELIRNGGDPYAKYTGLVKESHIKKMVDEVIAEQTPIVEPENLIVDVSQEDSESY
jgi:hypothetical protein